MALMLYQGSGITGESGNGPSTGIIGGDFTTEKDIENVANAIENLTSKARQKKYIGLGNQGATCYMNSLLQSLYMTPEFRQFIFSWQYNSELHGDKEYCIPYQLQKLFAKLQLSRRNYVDTKGLTKSFGWESADSFDQHDIQEFCSVLFDAIEQSIALAGEHCSTINELYQGNVVGFVKCEECGYESNKEDHFLNLTLPIKNEFGTGVQNSSVEMAIENYVKPEKLEGDNQYQCSGCNKKVNAVKGLKIRSCPKLLSIALSRFTLDWTTFQRVKITDSVSFPFILNMNDYLQGYEGIQNKLYEKEVERMNQFCKQQIEKNIETDEKKKQVLLDQKETKEREQMQGEDKLMDNIDNGDEEVINTSSKRHEKGIKIAVGDQTESKDAATGDDDGYHDNPYLYDTSGPRKKIDYGQLSSHNNNYDYDGDSVMYDEQQAQEGGAQFDGNNYKVTHKNERFAVHPLSSQTVKQQQQQQKEAPSQQNQEEKELEEALEKIREMEEKQVLSKTNEEQVLLYLKQGDFVYELFSVLVHSGGAHGGHYYAYIKSFQDGKWYNFNDSSVNEISKEKITEVYGDKYGGATAYMLMYRHYNPETQLKPIEVSDDLIPHYLKEEIETETDTLIKEQMEIEERLMNIKIKLRYKDDVKTFHLKKNNTLQEIALKAMEDFGIKDVELKDFRFRAYDMKLKVPLTPYENMNDTPIKLQFYNYIELQIQIKTPNEQFEEYDPNWLYLKVIKYVEGDDYNFSKVDLLPTQLIRVNKTTETVSDLDHKLSEMFGIPEDRLVVFLRHEHIYNSSIRSELYNIDWRKSKKIGDASKLDHGTILYIEEGDPKDQIDHFMWHEAFTKEQDKLILHLNDPELDPKAEVFDLRAHMKKSSTLLELKLKVSELTGLSTNEFILKRNAQSRELKDLKATLSSLGLYSGALVVVVKGTPHQEGVYEVNIIKVSLKQDSELDDVLFVEKPLCKLVIEPSIMGIQFKQKIVDAYNKQYPDNQVTVEQVRIRNPKSDDMGEVVIDSEPLENSFLYDDKDFYIQIIDPSTNFEFVNPKHPNNSLHVLIREWDPETWNLGTLYEVTVDKMIHASKFAGFLSEKVFPHIPVENLMCAKIHNVKNFKRGDLILKRWNKLQYQMVWLGQSTLEINRDSAYIMVKDSSKKVREELTDEEMKKYSSASLLNHLQNKQNKEIGIQHKDMIFQTSQQYKPDYSNQNKRPEKGIKINIGAPQQKQDKRGEKTTSVESQNTITVHVNGETKVKTDNARKVDMTIQEQRMEDDDDEAGDVYMEPLF